MSTVKSKAKKKDTGDTKLKASKKAAKEETVIDEELAKVEVADVDADQEVAPADVVQQELDAQKQEEEADAEGEKEDDDLGLKENVTKETKGENLGDVENKSRAATEKFKGGDDDTFKDIKNNANNLNQYSEGNIVAEEENDGFGFEDNEEIQPRQSAAMIEQHLTHILSSWTQVEKIGLERFGIVLMKNILKFSPESLQLFQFKDIPDLYKNEIFKSHCLMMMQKIEKTIHNLSDLEYMKDTTMPKCEVKNLNRRVTSEIGQKVGECLILTMKQGFKAKFTNEVKLGWESLFQ